jgi:PIN domain nuclease of toxin-antitoxin system
LSRVLIDTHIALWSIIDSPKMPPKAWSFLRSPNIYKLVSTVSIWECSVKFRLNRGSEDDMPLSGADALAEFVAAGYEILPILPEHAADVDRLPPHHRDPFDRLMIAQARHEPLQLLTHDSKLADYGEFVVVV